MELSPWWHLPKPPHVCVTDAEWEWFCWRTKHTRTEQFREKRREMIAKRAGLQQVGPGAFVRPAR
jgi:hypothetical protein